MFTGIIEEMGTVLAITKNAQSAVLRIAAKTVTEDVKRGDSIAVNGVCLTVTSHRADEFTADVMHETLDRSSLGELHEGSKVNLERALRLDSRLGGHIVTGHIDGTGRIRRVRADANAIWYSIAAGAAILNGIVEKGSVAVDGISLTVAKVTGQDFSVSVIPHTAAHTTLSGKREGAVVNLETDCIGKYVAKLLGAGKNGAGSISQEFLAEHGFLENADIL